MDYGPLIDGFPGDRTYGFWKPGFFLYKSPRNSSLSHDLDVASQGLYSNDQTWRAWESLVEIYGWENHLEPWGIVQPRLIQGKKQPINLPTTLW